MDMCLNKHTKHLVRILMKIKDPILALALPSVVSNITVPLLGLIDLAIVGHMGTPLSIAAIAIGGTIFNMIYWIFAFLRMGTTGMVSLSYGEGNTPAIRIHFSRSIVVATIISIALLALQVPLYHLCISIMAPESAILPFTSTYFYVCIWGAPAMLYNYCFTGCFIGIHDTHTPMMMAIVQNVMNIMASLLFVFGFGMGVEGVAGGTVAGIYSGLIVALWRMHNKNILTPSSFTRDWGTLIDRKELRRFFDVNRDIFIRTLCIIAVTCYFTTAGSRQGAVILDANTILMQLFILFSYFTDGLANASEALAGEYAGRGDEIGLRAIILRLFKWGIGLVVAFTLAYALFGSNILSLLTDQQEVVEVAKTYLKWIYFVPACGIMAFVWDGIFIGMTMTRGMLISMAIATLTFFAVWIILKSPLDNHGLWIAFLSYLLMRGSVQTIIWKRRKTRLDATPKVP